MAKKKTQVEDDARFRRIVEGIKEFGYSNVTDEEVRQAIDSVKNGKEAQNVLEMFIERVIKQRETLRDEQW